VRRDEKKKGISPIGETFKRSDETVTRHQKYKLLVRAEERDKRLESHALAASQEGDDESCWMAMAARAENARFLAKLKTRRKEGPQGVACSMKPGTSLQPESNTSDSTQHRLWVFPPMNTDTHQFRFGSISSPDELTELWAIDNSAYGAASISYEKF
jgi:hypothetical protein